MSNELVAVAQATQAVAVAKGKNYVITSPLTGNEVKIERDTDFGVIPGTKKPSLFKSGAEKIIMAYGLMVRPEIVSKIEQYGKDAFFFYNVKCELWKGFTSPNGEYKEVCFAVGYGSANSGEKRNGFNDAVNSANNALKMAQKRALVQAAITISGLSSLFTMDIEDEQTKVNANALINEDPEASLSKPQYDRIFGTFHGVGYTQNEAKAKLKEWGFASTKDVKQKDIEEVIKKIKALGDGEQKEG